MIEIETSRDNVLHRLVEVVRMRKEIEATEEKLRDEALRIFTAEDIKTMIVMDCRITKVTRTSFNVTIEDARKLQATEMVEQINREKLKALRGQGMEIPTTTTETLMIRV